MNKEIETENNEECFICKEEFNNKSIDLQSFPCNICVKGNWYICKVCNDKIIKNLPLLNAVMIIEEKASD